MEPFDVYSFGVVSSSTLIRIHGDFPASQGYAELEDIHHMTGGEAANSSMVLARLGVRVRLDGNWLGADEAGVRTRGLLLESGIDVSRLLLREHYQGVAEMVIADEYTRTIFGSYGKLLENAEWNRPRAEDVIDSRVVCLDPFFKDASADAARLAAGAGVPVVTVDCRVDDPLAAQASALVIAESFLQENYPDHDPTELFEQYRERVPGLLVFTFGDKPLWYARGGGAMSSHAPFPVDPVDTTGGGDAFRAGIVYGVLKGWSDSRTVAFAAAVAALVCTRFPGVLNAPTLEEVSRFLESQGSDHPPAAG